MSKFGSVMSGQGFNFGDISSSFGHSRSVVHSYFEHLTVYHYIALVVVVLFIILVVLYFVNPDFKTYVSKMSEGFKSLTSTSTVGSSIDNLDVLFFYSETCNYCKQMKDLLNKDNLMQFLTPIDVASEDGRKLVEQYNVKQGVPAFVSVKNNTTTVGLKTPELVVSELMNKANTIQPVQPVQQMPADLKSLVDSLDIVLFKTSTCGHCKRALSELDDLVSKYGISVTVLDLQTNEGQQAFQESQLESKGVPVYWSRSKGTSSVGARPFNETLARLVSQQQQQNPQQVMSQQQQQMTPQQAMAQQMMAPQLLMAQ